jgi:hypothetical protein
MSMRVIYTYNVSYFKRFMLIFHDAENHACNLLFL